MGPFILLRSTTVKRSYGILTVVTPFGRGWGAQSQNRVYGVSRGQHRQIESMKPVSFVFWPLANLPARGAQIKFSVVLAHPELDMGI